MREKNKQSLLSRPWRVVGHIAEHMGPEMVVIRLCKTREAAVLEAERLRTLREYEDWILSVDQEPPEKLSPRRGYNRKLMPNRRRK